MTQPFQVVEQFERALAEFSRARFAVATATGTAALFLSLVYSRTIGVKGPIHIPARTFISVPMAARHAGYEIEFVDRPWEGIYVLHPSSVVDGALRFRRGMYRSGLHCLSFHARKLLNIGEGGAVLTDSESARDWLMRARYSGRAAPGYCIEDVEMLGWQCYMTPEKAARGLHLLEYIADDMPDQVMKYPDLREAKIFQHGADQQNSYIERART